MFQSVALHCLSVVSSRTASLLRLSEYCYTDLIVLCLGCFLVSYRLDV